MSVQGYESTISNLDLCIKRTRNYPRIQRAFQNLKEGAQYRFDHIDHWLITPRLLLANAFARNLSPDDHDALLAFFQLPPLISARDWDIFLKNESLVKGSWLKHAWNTAMFTITKDPAREEKIKTYQKEREISCQAKRIRKKYFKRAHHRGYYIASMIMSPHTINDFVARYKMNGAEP